MRDLFGPKIKGKSLQEPFISWLRLKIEFLKLFVLCFEFEITKALYNKHKICLFFQGFKNDMH